jgi:SHAQKYF class myb-like DNA-binding protein
MSRNLRSIAVEASASQNSKNDTQFSNGRWTKEEHQRFVDAIKLYGKNWKKVEEYIGTRSGPQVRSHAQKFFLKLDKELKKGKNENVKAVRKFTDHSISTNENRLDNLSDFDRAEDNLKGNLPFHEVCENATEASENTKAHPLSLGSPLLGNEKNAQVQKSDDLKTNQVLFPQKLFYHQIVFLDFMRYFSKFNKSTGSLKLSDFVDLSSKVSVNDENAYELPVGGKKVKIL